jgi:hypothetical protein
MSLFPLGILSAAAGGVEAGPAFELITSTILTGTQATVTFDSLGTYAADYKHLQIRLVARTNRGSDAADHLIMQMNSTVATAAHTLYASGSSVTSALNLFGPKTIGMIAAPAFPTNAFAPGVVDILDPYSSTSKNKTIRSFVGLPQSGGAFRSVTFSSAFFPTDTTTSITLSCLASFIAGSRFSLYGIKG